MFFEKFLRKTTEILADKNKFKATINFTIDDYLNSSIYTNVFVTYSGGISEEIQTSYVPTFSFSIQTSFFSFQLTIHKSCVKV